MEQLSGLGALSTYSPSPLVISGRIPQRIFLFLFLEYSSNAPLFPECPQHPQSPVQLYQRSLQRPLAVLHPPFPPQPTQDDPRPKPLAEPTTTSPTIFLAPLPPTTLKEGYFPQLPPSLLHHLPDFRDRHKFGKQKSYVRSLQAGLSSSNGKSVSENCGDLDKR